MSDNFEDRVRESLEKETRGVTPAAESWAHLAAKIARDRIRRIWFVALGAAAILSISVLGIYAAMQQTTLLNVGPAAPESPQPPIEKTSPSPSPVVSPGPLPDGAPKSFVGIDTEGRILLLSSEDGAVIRELARKKEPTTNSTFTDRVELSPDGKYVYFDELDNLDKPMCKIRIKRVSLEARTPELIAARGTNPAISPDGKSLAYITGKSDCYGRTLVIRDLSSGKERRWSQAEDIPEYSLEHDALLGLKWSPDSRYLLYGLSSEDGTQTVLFDPSIERDLDDPKRVLPVEEGHIWNGLEWRAKGGVMLAGDCGDPEHRCSPKLLEYDPVQKQVIRSVPDALHGFMPWGVNADRTGKHLLLLNNVNDPDNTYTGRWHGNEVFRIYGPLLNADWW